MTVAELFADYDPQRDELDTHIVREWEREQIVYRYVTYHIGRFKQTPARMAAFYAFPKGGQNLPGLLHLHGGGQRAFLHEVEYYAKLGYACLSINWGGREMEQAMPEDPNTDWGAVNPTQTNVMGYFNLKPGELSLDPVESPRNNNWYLLTLGARRGLTFLERQTEVDATRLGVYGHSMGGNLTIYVAGTDTRVKVAAPSVGGSGFRTQPWPLLPEQQKRIPNGNIEMYAATIDFDAYAPGIQAPTLWLGSTNDFHGIMDDTYLTGRLIPHTQVRYAFTPHMNHRFTPEFAVTRPLWIGQYLKGNFDLPDTPQSQLKLTTTSGTPTLSVTPDRRLPIIDVQLMYSVDPDPQARFWRTAHAKEKDHQWSAELPVMSTDQPLFAYANVYYSLETPHPVPFARLTNSFSISGMLHTATPQDLQAANVRATDEKSLVIDNFQSDWQDWYTLSSENPHHWEYSTRKLNDPKWRGETGQQLVLEVQAEQANKLILILTENFFRPYRGPSREYTHTLTLNGGNRTESLVMNASDFRDIDGHPLSSWQHVDLLSMRAYYDKAGTRLGSKYWSGPQPDFKKLAWQNN